MMDGLRHLFVGLLFTWVLNFLACLGLGLLRLLRLLGWRSGLRFDNRHLALTELLVDHFKYARLAELAALGLMKIFALRGCFLTHKIFANLKMNIEQQ